jgi:cell division protein FtsB
VTLVSNSDLNGGADDDGVEDKLDDGPAVVENDDANGEDTVVLGLSPDELEAQDGALEPVEGAGVAHLDNGEDVDEDEHLDAEDVVEDEHLDAEDVVEDEHLDAEDVVEVEDLDDECLDDDEEDLVVAAEAAVVADDPAGSAHDVADEKAPPAIDTDPDTEPEADHDAVSETEAPVAGALAAEPTWRGQDVAEVVRKVLAVLVVLPAIGYGLGALRGESYVSRSEFVYSLDGSVPDGFLREDRRLLTQIVTFTSDAVLGPVAEEYDLEVEQLRAKIDVETVDLSEVLRLEVSDNDAARALELNRAVLEQHLRTVTGENTTDFSQELTERRADIAAELDAAAADGAEQQAELAALAAREQQLERQISLLGTRLDRLRALEDEALAGNAVSRSAVTDELETVDAELTEAEAELTDVRIEQAEVDARIDSGSSARRTIERLEADLAAVDSELSRRELAPVVGSAFRELSEPTVIRRTRHIAGLQGLAVGMLLALPVAAYAGYRARRRQLWLD